MTPSAELATFAPAIAEPPNFVPAGNLSVALPEIDRHDGKVHSAGVVLAACSGVLTARGSETGLATPSITVDGNGMPLAGLSWSRVADWLPRFTVDLPSGRLSGYYLAPIDERGFGLRLQYEHTAERPADIGLQWAGCWDSTSVEHLRGKPVEGTWEVRDDGWTNTRVVSLSSGLPLLAVAWRAGPGVALNEGVDRAEWRADAAGRCATGEVLTADVYVGVAPETDGACTTALHLRRRGFDRLWAETTGWLSAHRLDSGRPAVDAKINENLFFSWFYAQADALDDGRPVMLTSRSPRYYVSAAFWSRDAYCWSFPAFLLVDHRRTRQVLVSSLRAGGTRLADHALYLNGTILYPGFELDQAAAPILAVARYVRATEDWTVLDEPDVAATLLGLVARMQAWKHPTWALYATFLLPTDDPTDFPYVTTANALVAAAFDALADLVDGAAQRGSSALHDAQNPPHVLHRRAADIRAALTQRLVVDGRHGRMWAWACAEDGAVELRDEAPLGLRSLPFWGVGDWSDPLHVATRAWLEQDFEHQYGGRFGGAGAPHFPYPSGFDLANRLLDAGSRSPDPLRQLVDTPMDQGLACESWDRDTGRVTTGAAMASMAGLLVWTARARLDGCTRWDDLVRRAPDA